MKKTSEKQVKKVSRPPEQGDSVRTTVSMPTTLWEECQRIMKISGYGKNFSAFMQEAARERLKSIKRHNRRHEKV